MGVEADRLAAEPKRMPEKKVLARWLRQRTTVGRQWIGERLWIGEESGVSRAEQMGKASEDKEMERLKERLLETFGHEGGNRQ